MNNSDIQDTLPEVAPVIELPDPELLRAGKTIKTFRRETECTQTSLCSLFHCSLGELGRMERGLPVRDGLLAYALKAIELKGHGLTEQQFKSAMYHWVYSPKASINVKEAEALLNIDTLTPLPQNREYSEVCVEKMAEAIKEGNYETGQKAVFDSLYPNVGIAKPHEEIPFGHIETR